MKNWILVQITVIMCGKNIKTSLSLLSDTCTIIVYPVHTIINKYTQVCYSTHKSTRMQRQRGQITSIDHSCRYVWRVISKRNCYVSNFLYWIENYFFGDFHFFLVDSAKTQVVNVDHCEHRSQYCSHFFHPFHDFCTENKLPMG